MPFEGANLLIRMRGRSGLSDSKCRGTGGSEVAKRGFSKGKVLDARF
jgi:hypothetical protein